MRDFLAARLSAIDYQGAFPCNPRFDPGFSVRGTMYYRGQLSTGTNGHAFVTLDAYQCLTGNNNLCYSTSAWASGAGGVQVNPLPAGVQPVATTFAYNSAVPTPAKIVALQLRLVPNGKLLDTAGTIYRLVAPENIRLGDLSEANIANNPEIAWTPLKHSAPYINNWTVRNSTVDDSFLAYGTVSGTAIRSWNLGFYISGATPGYSYTIEIRGFYEYPANAGAGISGATYSPVYSNSASKVETLNSQLMSSPSTVDLAGYWAAAKRILITDVAPQVVAGLSARLPTLAAGVASAVLPRLLQQRTGVRRGYVEEL